MRELHEISVLATIIDTFSSPMLFSTVLFAREVLLTQYWCLDSFLHSSSSQFWNTQGSWSGSRTHTFVLPLFWVVLLCLGSVVNAFSPVGVGESCSQVGESEEGPPTPTWSVCDHLASGSDLEAALGVTGTHLLACREFPGARKVMVQGCHHSWDVWVSKSWNI